MAWVESHTVLNRHRKVKDLAVALNIKPVYALGHLHALWHTALEQQEDGNIRNWSDTFLASAADFEGDPADFRKALEGIHWLDDGLIHDWLDYAGRFLRGKYAGSNIQRLKEIWAVHGRRYGKPTRSQHKTNKNPSTPYHTVPNLPNLPNHTVPTKPTPCAALPPCAFETVWERYPRKTGTKAAVKHFGVSVKTMPDFLDIQKAMDNYLKSDRVKRGFIQNGSTWFNNWRDWINYTEIGGSNGNGQSKRIANQHVTAEAGRYAGLAERTDKPA